MSVDWRKTEWEVEFAPIDKLIDQMKQIPERSEKVMNDVLHKKSNKETIRSITEGIPISKVKHRILNKKHAKTSHPLSVKNENLGFSIRPKKTYDYLKYPDLGIGTSIKNQPQRFMRKGMEREVETITEDLTIALMKAIEEKLGGK